MTSLCRGHHEKKVQTQQILAFLVVSGEEVYAIYSKSFHV